MRRIVNIITALAIAMLILPWASLPVEAEEGHHYELAYQELIPETPGDLTELDVFPSTLGGSNDNWLAVSHPYKDIAVGTPVLDLNGDPISQDISIGAIRVESTTDNIVISAGALSDRCNFDIEVSDYNLYGGAGYYEEEIVVPFDGGSQKLLVNPLRATFRDYVYGTGTDLYELEDIPQSNSTVDYKIDSVIIRALVTGQDERSEATTAVLTNGEVFRGAPERIRGPPETLIETEYTTNPATGLEWTWQEIERLQAGVTLEKAECSWIKVFVRFWVGSQTFFPITPVEVSPTSYNTWTDVDCSSHIASGATGVILHVVNKHASTQYQFGARKNGSTDNRHEDLLNTTHFWAAIGVDSSRIFEAYIETSNIDIYLVAYTMSGVTFKTNADDKSPGSYNSWQDVDFSSEAPNADGLIFEAKGTSDDFGCRMNGSSDNRYGNFYRSCWAIIGCDDSQIAEVYIEDSGAHVYLIGYVTDGCTFNTNATNLSLGTTGSWTDLSTLPSGAGMAFIEVNATYLEYDYGLRKDGSSEDIYRDLPSRHAWGIVEAESQIVEGKISNTYVDFFLVGYSIGTVAPTVTTSAATNVEETTARLNGNVTDTGGEDPTVTVYWGDNDGGETPGNWDNNSAPTSPAQPQGVAAFYKDATGLAPGTTLYFNAKATNSAGTDWGTTQTFYTKPNPPTSLGDSAHTATTIDLSWTKGSGAEKTMVRYRTDQYPTGTSDGTQAYYDTGSSTQVTSLSNGQIYYFRAWAWDTNSGYSDDTSDDTAYTSPGNPSTLGDTDRTATTIDLSWSKGTGGDKTLIRYRTDQYPTGTSDGTQAYFDTGTSTTVSTLSNGQIYYFRSWAYDSDSGYYSDGTSDDTAYTNPGDPSSLTATTVSDTQIDLTWAKGTGGDKTHIRRKTGSYPTSVTDGDQVYFDTGTSHSDTGRIASTQYFYRAWAYDSDSGYYSDSYSQDTATTHGPPTVTTSAATNIEETTATIGGNITSTNGANATTRGVEWDTDSGSPYANDWHEDGSFGTGSYTHNLSSLTKGELYYFRAYATNTYGTGYGSEDTFLTKPDAPSSLTATAISGTQIDLSWSKGTGAQKTYIRGKDGSYPTDRSDGYLVYNATGSSTSDTGLTGGHTYYYKAWSYATEGGEEQYSDLWDHAYASPGLTLMLHIVWVNNSTVFADQSGYNHDATPTFRTLSSDNDVTAQLVTFEPITQAQISSWNLTTAGTMVSDAPSAIPEMYTELDTAHLPGGEWINETLDAGNIPRALFWFPIPFLIIVALGFFVHDKTRSLLMQVVVMAVAMAMFSLMGPLPFWLVIVFAFDSMAIIVASKQFGW